MKSEGFINHPHPSFSPQGRSVLVTYGLGRSDNTRTHVLMMSMGKCHRVGTASPHPSLSTEREIEGEVEKAFILSKRMIQNDRGLG